MYRFIRGTLQHIEEDFIVLENNGIGYMIYVTSKIMNELSGHKEDLLIYTEMIVREDDIKLYGFLNIDDLNLFNQLITVSGVGPKAAIAIMSSLEAIQIKKAIIKEDIMGLTEAHGIGKKTAQRIILELKEKIDLTDLELETSSANKLSQDQNQDAIIALTTLGYSKNEALSALREIDGEIQDVEQIIKEALRVLSK